MAKAPCTTLINGKEYNKHELMAALAKGEFEELLGKPKETIQKESSVVVGGATIETLNPTGGIFTDYSAEQRNELPLGENITTYDKTANLKPNDKITIYRGVPKGVDKIVSGDFITTNKQLAKDYAGDGKVISKEVRADEILDDKTEPLGEEYILREKPKQEEPRKGIKELEAAETIPEGVHNFEAALTAKTAPKKDKALKQFGEQEARAKELIDNYDTNLQKLKDNGVEPTGTKAEVLADMLSGKYDEVMGKPSVSDVYESVEATAKALEDIATKKPITNLNFEINSSIEDSLFDKYKGNKSIVYHGSPNISYLLNVESLNPKDNTQNAESKYVYVNPTQKVARNYSTSYNGYSDKSGIAAFKIKGKKYVMKKSDILSIKSNEQNEAFLDKKKEEGYDYIEIPQDGNNIAVLNKNALELIGVENNLKSISEAYHRAKADGTNPELVKAVEDLLGKPQEAQPAEQVSIERRPTTMPDGDDGVELFAISQDGTEKSIGKFYAGDTTEIEKAERNYRWGQEQKAKRPQQATEVEVTQPTGDKVGKTVAFEHAGGRKKTITARRAYEGEFREDVKRELEKIGLTREVESQEQVEADTKAFIESVGLDAAVDAVRAKDIEGAHAMEILNSKIEDIEKQMLGETDPDKLIQLAREQGEAIDELDQLNVKYGRGSSYMNRIYAKSDLGYNVEKLISDYKKENDGEISPEVEAKFRELDKQLKETNKKLKESEERLAEREAERAVANIKESVSRRKTRNKKDEAKQLIGEGLSDLADALGVKLMAVGDKRASIVTALSKIGRGLILNGEATLENVSQKVREYVNEKFGGKLNFDEYEEDFNTTIAEGAKTSGKIKIETQLIRDLVEGGIDNIYDLVAAVKERVVVDYPNATDREIRDAITGYGKIVNPTKDEVSVQLRRIKDIGRLVSAIEDVENKKRPLKSGLQRDKLNEEQRRLRKQLREAMKDLPIDTETQEQQMRTALDAAKARIRNRIEELQKDIESGERVEKSKRTVEADQELIDLRKERDELQAIHDSMFGGNEPTYEQRIEAAIKSAEKSITELERKIAEGDLEPKKGKELIPTQELKDLQDKRDGLQKELNKLRQEAKPKKTEAEIEQEKLNKAIEQKEKIRDELIEKISNQDISVKQRTPKSYDNDPRIIQLNAEIEVLNKKMRDLRSAQKIKKTEEQKAIEAIERQIKAIDQKIQAGGVESAKKPKLSTAAIEAAKERLNKKREELLKLKAQTGQIEQRRLTNAKKTAERRIAELQRRLREGDFSKKEKKPIMEDTELTRLKAEKIRIKEEYDKEFYKAKLKNRKFFERAKDYMWDAWGLTRALSATADLSFVGVQGWVNLLSHPIQSAKAFKTALQFAASEKRAEQWLNNLKAQEWYPILKESKLSITEPKAEMTAREELFNSGWTNVIWDVVGSPLKLANDKAYQAWVNANPMKALERASVGYLDTIRVQRFLDGMQMLEMQGKNIRDNKQDFKNVADVINTFTGRASLGAGEQIAPTLTKVFFSPRNWASILKQTILLPRQIIKWQDGKVKPSVANKMAISDLSKAIGLTSSMVLMAAAYLNNDDDPETSIETDPTSSDFGKLKFGDTRVDPWGGRIQQLILMARLITDSINKGGKRTPLGTGFGSPTREELIMEQAFNKLSPSAQLVHRYLTSKPAKDGGRITKYGEEYEFNQDVLDRLHPIIYDTIKELLEDDPNALDGLLIFYAMLGGGVNTYQEKKRKKEKVSIETL